MTDHMHDIAIEDLPEDLRQIADCIGFDKFIELVKLCGHGAIYLPKMDSIAIPARNRRIRAEFNGQNYRELAKKYNLTERWVRAIVAGDPETDKKRQDPLEKQLTLF